MWLSVSRETMSQETKNDVQGGGDNLNISIKLQDGPEVHFRVKKTTKMNKIFAAFYQKTGLTEGSLRFLHDGARISGDSTPKQNEMEDGDSIDAMLWMIGGYWIY
eukprot:Rmarinus@m.28828